MKGGRIAEVSSMTSVFPHATACQNPSLQEKQDPFMHRASVVKITSACMLEKRLQVQVMHMVH